MAARDTVRTLERELAELAARLTAVAWRECVLCYVNRMIVAHGCDGTLRWTRAWRRARAPRATRLERRAGLVGAYCDCELFTNCWDVDPMMADASVSGFALPIEALSGCRGVRPGSTQPCPQWIRRGRRARW